MFGLRRPRNCPTSPTQCTESLTRLNTGSNALRCPRCVLAAADNQVEITQLNAEKPRLVSVHAAIPSNHRVMVFANSAIAKVRIVSSNSLLEVTTTLESQRHRAIFTGMKRKSESMFYHAGPPRADSPHCFTRLSMAGQTPTQVARHLVRARVALMNAVRWSKR